LHELNPHRLAFIKRHTGLKDQKVLDVGCGGGILTEALAKEGAHTTGIDMGHAVLEVARLHALESHLNIDYQETLVENFALQHAHSFNVVTCMEMLEHVPDPQSVVNACAQLVAPGGYVFFSTLNRNVVSYIQSIIGAEYILRLLPRGTHDYQHFIKPAELGQWLREADLTIKDLSGLTYNPFTRQFRLTQDTKVNYLVCAQYDK
jgi:2-polyprenyl-6-hydroxyphenyl methylase/3-demethylubiquinone-9 3-methyltransferase